MTKLNHFQPASLQEIALINLSTWLYKLPYIKNKICSTDWKYNDDDENISTSSLYIRRTIWEISDCIRTIIGENEACVSLRTKILNTIKKMVLQTMKWIKYHNNIFEEINTIPEICLDGLCWTFECLINKKATAELLVKQENLNVNIRFKLSCIYCLESDIFVLWSRIPQSSKSHYLHPHTTNLPELTQIWSSSLWGRANNLRKNSKKLNNLGFMKSLQGHNDTGMIYFWEKLATKCREKLLENSLQIVSLISETCHPLTNQYLSDVCYFLISCMNKRQQFYFLLEDLGMNRISMVLTSFLDWPYHNCFIPMVELMWSFLPLEYYVDLLYKLTDKIVSSLDANYDYRNLITEFWLKSPNRYKEFFLNKENNEFLYRYLGATRNFTSDDVTIIAMVFKEATQKEKEHFKFNFHGKDLCCKLIKNHRWKLVDVLIKICISSEVQMVKFKKEVITSIVDGLWFIHFISQKKVEDIEQFIKWCLFSEVKASVKGSEDFGEICKQRLVVIRKFFWWSLSSIEYMDGNDDTYRNFTFKICSELLESLVSWCFSCKEELEEFKNEMIYEVIKIYDNEILKEIILKDKLQEIYNFIHLPSDGALNKYKEDLKFCLKEVLELGDFMYENRFESVKRCIPWNFYYKSDNSQFIKDFSQAIKKVDLIENSVGDVLYIDELISWCWPLENICHFKKGLCSSIKNKYRINNLIYNENLDIIEKLITWSSSFKKEINIVKDEINRSNYITRTIRNNEFNWIKGFCDWSVLPEQGRNNYKRMLLNPKTYTELKNLLFDGRLETVDGCISWCLPYEEDRHNIRQELLFYIKKDYRFKQLICDYRQDFIENIMVWGLKTETERSAFKSELVSSLDKEYVFLDLTDESRIMKIHKFMCWCYQN